MPAINKIRLTNVVYEEGKKRYNDEVFLFDGYNGAILLENGGGKTVFIQTVLQAVIPHTDLADRKIKNTLVLENAPAHIAIEWLLNDKPRRYLVTAVTLFMTKDGLDSLRYVYEYGPGDKHGIEEIPFVRRGKDGNRPADRGEMQDYYSHMKDRFPLVAHTFSTIKDYRKFIEEQYHIIVNEWDSIVKINSTEGGVETFFENCKTTTQLFDRLLIPTVEDSIAGHNPNLFADMFEKQLDSLKRYKKLKETIEENKRIQEQLEKYVQTFEKLHLARQNYEKSKQKAKGIWEEIHIQKSEVTAAQQNLEELLQGWEQKNKRYEIKQASYQIAVEQEKFDRLREEFEQVNADYHSKKEELDTYNKEFFSLKLAQCKQELRQHEEEITYVESEMDKLTEKEELHDLEIQLEQANQALLGYFLKTMEEIQDEIKGLQYELNPILDYIEKIQQEIDSNRKLEQMKQQDLAGVRTTIETRTGDMKKLEQSLLANPEQEQVYIELEKWRNRYHFLDEEIIRLESEKKSKNKEIIELDQRIERQKDEKNDLTNELRLIVTATNQIEAEQSEVIKQLSSLRPQWSTLDSVYEHEQSIENRLMETVEKLNREKEEYLYKERVAYRLDDDYQEQVTFFSDPVIEKRIKTWKNQLDYCVTGIEYLQGLDEKDYQNKVDYPLWAVTLVTTKKSKPTLQKKIEEIADQLRFPIQILTTEEAALIQKETKQEEFAWITPSHWEMGLNDETFEQWKQEILVEAKKSKTERVAKENELKQWEKGLHTFRQFVQKYPYEKVTDLHTKQSELMRDIEELDRQINHSIQTKDGLLQQIEQIEQTVKQHRDEMQGLERKIEKAYEYVKYRQEVADAKASEKLLLEEIAEIQNRVKRLETQLKDYAEQKEFLEERKRDLEAEIRSIEKSDEYDEVRSLTPVYTNESKKIIQDKIRTLQYKLHEINTSYGELQVRLKSAQDNVERLTREMKELREESSDLDENLVFPTDGEELIQKLNVKIKEVKEELSRLQRQVQEKASARDVQKGAWQSKVQSFEDVYHGVEIVTFTDPLDKVKVDLQQEKKALRDEKKYIDEQMHQVERERNSIHDAERLLERYIEKHHFNAPQVEAISLSVDEKTEFTYNRKKFARVTINELENRSQQVDHEEEHVGKQKQAFKQFCTTITDYRLQKMAENGVEYKTTYEDLLDFKKNMMLNIERTTNYANESIRREDEELQAYINRIHAHLKTVVEELKHIPKNTKIKVDGQWKMIYEFKIPEWQEEEGKQRIRNHIDWILKQLESDRYLKEDDVQDEAKIRKDLEMWLQTKQLLQIVMNNEAMKVSCRKVTNENKVTTRSYSWEQSNVWSGGEKWSKNMTLFLGLLNYVAEKKTHQQKRMKHNRAVILDNPFGKASSDHVLNPVFFVAEQLGFQIIALTAHAEGKFLQDYFPIIYSCRLRDSKDSEKQIMTKEKWLHRAYFQDHEPETLERLAETEQMTLF